MENIIDNSKFSFDSIANAVKTFFPNAKIRTDDDQIAINTEHGVAIVDYFSDPKSIIFSSLVELSEDIDHADIYEFVNKCNNSLSSVNIHADPDCPYMIMIRKEELCLPEGISYNRIYAGIKHVAMCKNVVEGYCQE